ncbi:hypothetical protein GF339_09275 [candidate division KSB3 bacterium]|uniref:Uncharacterized protein n=1 Tax=candidate division KSB3 bacterium TaxID=2044937 RepID=A0A9D5Q5F1_9BACT|nr:hypothetical protein [candidate division KSB3 bacterium]MBD3324764.1 hypothetical protein [candidate division KSB3 bacterium]
MIVSMVLLIGALLVCCYLPAFALFHPRSQPVSLAHVWVYIAVGLGSLGGLTVCTKAAGMDLRASVIPGIVLSIYTLVRHGHKCVPQIQLGPYNRHTVLAISLSAIYLLHILLPGIVMGRGSYPAGFFNVDTAYYLGQIHEFIQSQSWPPPSLSFVGAARWYHYGSQGVCALLAILTGFAPHTSAFLIYMPLLTLGIVSGAWLIVDEYHPHKSLLWIGILLLLFADFYPIRALYMIVYRSFSNIRALGNFRELLLSPEVFDHGYPMLSGQFGLFAAVLLLYCLQQFEFPARQRLAAFTVGILIIFKSSYFLVLGVGFGVWSLLDFFRRRNVKVLVSPLTALLVAVVLQVISHTTQLFSLVVAPWQFFLDKEYLFNTFGTFIIYALPIVVIFFTSQAKWFPQRLWRYWAFIVPPMVFVNIFSLVKLLKEPEFTTHTLFQMLYLLPLFFGMFVFAGIRSQWSTLDRRVRRLTVFLVVFATMAPVSHTLLHAAIPLVAPSYGHEYVDNRALAEALATISVQGSVIVTNDFRYPAQNYRRDLRQLQFPALFGHQAYAINFTYEWYPDSEERLRRQQAFRQSGWNVAWERWAKELGWTHLVIHRDSPHPESIPLPRIFENKEYQVYTFE